MLKKIAKIAAILLCIYILYCFRGLLLFAIIGYILFKVTQYIYTKSNDKHFEHNIEIEGSEFNVKGNDDRFIIRKNDRFEFIIENGKIIAGKDRTRHEKFTYYKET